MIKKFKMTLVKAPQKLYTNLFERFDASTVRSQVDSKSAGIYFVEDATLADITTDVFTIFKTFENRNIKQHNETFTVNGLSTLLVDTVIKLCNNKWIEYCREYREYKLDGSKYSPKEIAEFFKLFLKKRILIAIHALSDTNIRNFSNYFAERLTSSLHPNGIYRIVADDMCEEIGIKINRSFVFMTVHGQLAISNLQSVFLSVNTIINALVMPDYTTVSETFLNLLHIIFHLEKHGNVTPIKITNIPMTMGADPELELLERINDSQPNFLGPTKHASEFISNPGGQVGLDGFQAIAELRPTPSENPTDVAINLKKLINTLYRQTGKNSLIECVASGGVHHSVGGHIHFGNKELNKMSYNNQLKHLGELLDAFLYFPIRNNMPGAIRTWGNHINKSCAKNIEDFLTIAKTIKGGSCDNGTYDHPSAFRPQNHGLEYRSLPSFICDFTFTRLVLKIAQGIAKDFLATYYTEKEYSYNDPPQKADYLKFLTEKEYGVWNSYLFGHRNDRMLKSIFENWAVARKKLMDMITIKLEDNYKEKACIIQHLIDKYTPIINKSSVPKNIKIKMIRPDVFHILQTPAKFFGTIVINDRTGIKIGVPSSIQTFDLLTTVNRDGRKLAEEDEKAYFETRGWDSNTHYIFDEGAFALSHLLAVAPPYTTKELIELHKLSAEIAIEHLIEQYGPYTGGHMKKLSNFLGGHMIFNGLNRFLKITTKTKSRTIREAEYHDEYCLAVNKVTPIYIDYCKWLRQILAAEKG